MVKFGILGGGIVGLSTAAALKDTFRDCTLVICAPDKINDLPSYGAAGCFRPDPTLMPALTCCLSGECCPDCPFNRWCTSSKSHYWATATSSVADKAGVFFHPMFDLYNSRPLRPSFAAGICGSERRFEGYELEQFGFANAITFGHFYITCMIEGRDRMPFLLSQLKGPNTQFTYTHLQSQNDICSWATKHKVDMVVNCTGLGATILCNDRHLIPVRGSIVRVSAPWLKFGINAPQTTYGYVGRESVILGGFREPLPSILDKPLEPNVTAVSPQATNDIIRRFAKLWRVPVHQAAVLEEWTGLRPHRDVVRLELNWLDGNELSTAIPIVHNYGHGSMGVSLSWGTAMDVVHLVQESQKVSTVSKMPNLHAPGLEKLALS